MIKNEHWILVLKCYHIDTFVDQRHKDNCYYIYLLHNIYWNHFVCKVNMNLSVTAIHMLGDNLDAQDCLRYTVYRTSMYIYYYSDTNVEKHFLNILCCCMCKRLNLTKYLLSPAFEEP